MAISVYQLRQASQRFSRQKYRGIDEAVASRKQTAFLCHSHHDAELVKGLIQLMNDAGWDVYVDWLDNSMPNRPNKITALNIKKRIRDCDWFIFLATQNSMASRWCPWEIGVADGIKSNEQIVIVPTSDGASTRGNEYLELYRSMEPTTTGSLALYDPGNNNGILLRNLRA